MGSKFLGYRKIAAHVLKVRIRRKQVNRYRIMNTRFDTGFFEMETKGVAMCAFDYKQVVDVIRIGSGRLNRHVSDSREDFSVECGPFPALRVPLVQVGQFYAQDGRLKAVEPRIDALDGMVVLGALSVVSQRAQLCRDRAYRRQPARRR